MNFNLIYQSELMKGHLYFETKAFFSPLILNNYLSALAA